MPSDLNIFRTVAADLTNSSQTIYSAPIGYSSIVLLAQISNNTANPASFTFSFVNNDSTEYNLVKEFPVPGNDAAAALTGKLVLEENEKIAVESNVASGLSIVVSVLESKN